ncbi:MAG TPA: cupin domain-containing protein [Anaerohalosphaeraceae bacterium]|jgi:mannose-6-phosphate isomerase-like protein (cupin superfamily)|nr:cupin domain-containing protein [Anaerohalosphaeraceae bacterium]HRT49504.1 cupin domain-containing protein [Anaerohalosphaeraceae bacterium]HRT85334.1 cupin domain-containing protein [Anaerohalosphaeraceae bacterium]
MTEKPFTIDLTDAPEYQQLLEGAPQTCGMRSGRVYLKPNQECGRHSTKAHEEILVFLAGTGIAQTGPNNENLPVGQGKVIYIPPHTDHNIINTGTTPLIYIYCVAPITT